MSIYYCGRCGDLKNNDTNVCTDVGGELWCEGCCSSLPGDWEDYTITYVPPPIPIRTWDWGALHKDYDPPDARFFCGKNVADLIEQINEYNEERL